MGIFWSSCCSDHGMAATASVQVNTSPQIMWETIADIEAMVDYMDYVIQVERITKATTRKQSQQSNGKTPKKWEEGLMWKETRSYQGQSIVLHKTVTSLKIPLDKEEEKEKQGNNNENKFSVCIHVSFPGSAFEGATNTSTLSVVPLENNNDDVDNKCLLIGSLAVIDVGPIARCINILCCRQLSMDEREIQQSFQAELQSMATEAERRAQQTPP